MNRIRLGDEAVFMPRYSAFVKIPAIVDSISETNVEHLSWPSLSSVYGGPLSANMGSGDSYSENQIELVQGIFSVNLKPSPEQIYHLDKKEKYAQIGTVRINAQSRSVMSSFIKRILALFIRETNPSRNC